MTKICSVGFNHDAKLLYRNWSQKIKPFWRYFMWRNQAIWFAERILRAKFKNQTAKLVEIAINLLFLWMPICMQKLSIMTNLVIPSCMPRCDWPHPYQHTKSYLCILNHIQKVKFITKFIFAMQLTHCFQLLWAACLTTPLEMIEQIFKLIWILNHVQKNKPHGLIHAWDV